MSTAQNYGHRFTQMNTDKNKSIRKTKTDFQIRVIGVHLWLIN